MRKLVSLYVFLLVPGLLCAKINPDTLATADTDTIVSLPVQPDVPSPADSSNATPHKSKKLIAAILSFPLPFGILGLHRVVLGTKPYIPFVYIGTLGGCFGILPLIDFITIVSSNEAKMKTYADNPKVFMWAK